MSRKETRAGAWLEAVRRHADWVVRHARDPFGGTPLLANAADAESGRPVALDLDHVGRECVLSNAASQQPALRMLRGLGRLAGIPDYVEAAAAVVRFLFDRLTDGSGLLYWGGHTAYDLRRGRVVFASDKGGVHELKFHYPDYDLMWEVDAAATRRFVEAFWNAHVIDWSILDFNRHGPYDRPLGRVWRHEYVGGPVFFWGKGLTFVNTGSDLYYAAAMLAKHADDPAPLAWAKRLARRYVETRQGHVGISGYQFSQSATAWCDGPDVRGDRAQYQIAPLVPEGHLVYEGTLFRPRPVVQRCQLFIGEKLGPEAGSEFTRWACEEMAAWGRHAYRASDNCFIPMLTDGWPLEGLRLNRKGYFGPAGAELKPIPATADFFWMYAAGWRSSGDPFLWSMARNIAAGLGCGDIGEPGGRRPRLDEDGPEQVDHRLLYGFLELYRATGTAAYLDYACLAAERLTAEFYADGRFVRGGLVRTDDPLPLALLHLAAALLGADEGCVPPVWK